MTLKHSNKLTIHYIIIQFCFWMHICFINGFVSFYLTQKGYNAFQIGLVIGISNLLSLIMQPYVASFADRSLKIRVKHIIAINAGISIILAIIVHFQEGANTLFMICYTLILLNIAIQVPLLNSLSAEHITLGHKLNYSLGRGFGSIAFATTSIVFGKILKNVGSHITMPLYIASGIIYIISVLCFESPLKSEIKDTHNAGNLVQFIKENKRFLLTSFAMFLIYCSPAVISSYLFQIVEHIGGDASQLGLALGLSAALELISMVLYPFIKNKVGSDAKILIMASTAFLIKIIFTFTATTLAGLYFAQSLQIISFGFYIPAQVYYVSKLIPAKDQVKGQMFMSMSSTLAIIFASVLGGFLYNSFGINTMLISGIVLNALGLVMLIFIIEK